MSGWPLLAAVVCALLAGPVRADLVTPDMVPLPVETLVTDQYRSFGLVFRQDWWGSYQYTGVWMSLDHDYLISAGTQSAAFVVPGTAEPATTDTLRLKIYSYDKSEFTLNAYGIDGGLLRSFSMLTEPYAEQWVTVEGPGIRSFTATERWWFPPDAPPVPLENNPGWWLQAVEFTPVAAVPEPGTLALFALGALGLASRAWRRPLAPRAAPVIREGFARTAPSTPHGVRDEGPNT